MLIIAPTGANALMDFASVMSFMKEATVLKESVKTTAVGTANALGTQ